MSESTDSPTKAHHFTALQLRFIEEYPKDCKKAAAARRAGCEPTNARHQGCEWYLNPHIRAAIDERMAKLSMSADEALKRTSDIAATRLNDYLKIELRQRPTEVAQPLGEAIAQLQRELDFEELYTARSIEVLGLNELDAEVEWAQCKAKVNRLRLQMLRYEMQLEANPQASRLVPGEPETYEAVDLDLVALAKAKHKGLLKSFAHTKEGIKVETYATDAALINILKLHGRFVEKVEVKDTTPINYGQLSDAALEEILHATRPAAE